MRLRLGLLLHWLAMPLVHLVAAAFGLLLLPLRLVVVALPGSARHVPEWILHLDADTVATAQCVIRRLAGRDGCSSE